MNVVALTTTTVAIGSAAGCHRNGGIHVHDSPPFLDEQITTPSSDMYKDNAGTSKHTKTGRSRSSRLLRSITKLGTKHSTLPVTGIQRGSKDKEDERGSETMTPMILSEYPAKGSMSRDISSASLLQNPTETRTPDIGRSASTSRLTSIYQNTLNERLQIVQSASHSEPLPMLISSKNGNSRNAMFYKVFRDIADANPVRKSYHCSLVRSILVQGNIFVTSNWFCFCSKIPRKKVMISISSVRSITKEKTAIIIPNAVRVVTDDKTYLFGSLISRDSTFNNMDKVWKEYQSQLDQCTTVSTSSTALESRDDFSSNSTGYCWNDQNNGDLPITFETIPTNSDIESQDFVDISQDIYEYHSSSSSSSAANDEVKSITTTSAFLSWFDRYIRALLEKCFRSKVNWKVGEWVGECKNNSLLTDVVQTRDPLRSGSETLAWLHRKKWTCSALFLCTTLVLFLLITTVLLAFKILQLHSAFRQNSDSNLINSNSRHISNSFEKDVYVSEQHYLALEQINAVLESHINSLDEINEGMKRLYLSSSRSLCFKDSSTVCETTSETVPLDNLQ